MQILSNSTDISLNLSSIKFFPCFPLTISILSLSVNSFDNSSANIFDVNFDGIKSAYKPYFPSAFFVDVPTTANLAFASFRISTLKSLSLSKKIFTPFALVKINHEYFSRLLNISSQSL